MSMIFESSSLIIFAQLFVNFPKQPLSHSCPVEIREFSMLGIIFATNAYLGILLFVTGIVIVCRDVRRVPSVYLIEISGDGVGVEPKSLLT